MRKVSVYLDEEDYEFLRERARRCGIGMSTYLRYVVKALRLNGRWEAIVNGYRVAVTDDLKVRVVRY